MMECDFASRMSSRRREDDLEWRKLRGRLWELRVSQGKLVVVRTRVIILMMVKF